MADPTTNFEFFNPTLKKGPYKFNEIYDPNGSNECSLYLSVYNEFVHLYGTDLIYIERSPNEEEAIFGEFLAKAMIKGFPMRLFKEEVEGWGGSGDIYSKFGLQIQDECTIYCPKITFAQYTNGKFPKYNDLFYSVNAKKLFEISHIEDELPPSFYLLGNRSGYVFTCKTYVYDHAEIKDDSSIPLEIQGLDKVLIDPSTGQMYDIDEKETDMNNEKIESVEVSGDLVDDTEIDPLMGG